MPVALPKHGSKPDEVLGRLRAARSDDAAWKEGKTFSLVYFAGEELSALLKAAYTEFMSENGLSPVAFPSLRRFEAEVVSMALGLMHAPEDAAGCMTSGGTESIMMALKSAREWARKEKGIARPHVVLPVTVHPAFEKAAHYFDLDVSHARVGPDYRLDVAHVEALMTRATALVVGSAPAYPHGLVDPIEDLAALAVRKGVLCHVDACVGGFILPFLRQVGRPLPRFDFEVDGVTSMSADLHKYGFAAKGASLVLYRSRALRRHQFYTYSAWPGGLYASPSMTGTRPGGAIAAAWATLQYFGEDGYRKLATSIMDVVEKLQRGINDVPGLKVLGQPHGPVFAFASDTLNVYALGDAMQARGWRLDRQQHPPALHLMVTPAHGPVADRFLLDLRQCAGSLAKGEPAPEGSAAMYGMVGQMPDTSAVDDFLVQFLDGLFDA